MTDGPDDLLGHFRGKLREDPVSAYRDWFRLQEELREGDQTATSRVLADDFWAILPELPFPAGEARARFFHNVAVFFGTPGPAADLARARDCFAVALSHFREHEESGWHARVLHNLATALSNLGTAEGEIEEAVTLFQKALEWRTAEREIARGVTLHNMGLALRRQAELTDGQAVALLERSASALSDAAAIRGRHSLSEGRALSLFHLGLTLERLAGTRPDDRAPARQAFEVAAALFGSLGKAESRAIALEHARANS